MMEDESEFLELVLTRQLGKSCHVESVSPLREEQGRRPIYLLRVRAVDHAFDAILHFRRRRQSPTQWEMEAMRRAAKQGVLVPRVLYCEDAAANPLGEPFRILEFVEGKKLTGCGSWLTANFEVFLESLCRVHLPSEDGADPPSLDSLRVYQEECSQRLRTQMTIDYGGLMDRFAALVSYFESHRAELSCARKSLLHGDLHSSNILITSNGTPCFLDWEMASEGDYCLDLAYLRSRTLDFLEVDAQLLYAQLLDRYEESFRDNTIRYRAVFYLAQRYFEYIWRSTYPRVSERWLPFFYAKLCHFMDTEAVSTFTV